MKISAITPTDFNTIYKVLTSAQISEVEKTNFLKANRNAVKEIMVQQISSADFKTLMNARPLQKFRPLKNSYTKWGDKIILAKALEIQPRDIPKYIKTTTKALEDLNKIDFLPENKLEMIKSYVYRHGNKDEIVTFLDYELTKSKDLTKTLYKTLDYHNNGIADYFIRPIHRMDNKTLIKIYHTICKHIKQASLNNQIDDMLKEKIAKWALIRIYEIQNNSKIINAIKTYKTLSH